VIRDRIDNESTRKVAKEKDFEEKAGFPWIKGVFG
jgi:hypothetical protein